MEHAWISLGRGNSTGGLQQVATGAAGFDVMGVRHFRKRQLAFGVILGGG